MAILVQQPSERFGGKEDKLIPDHSHDGVLPPFIPGSEPHEHGAMAPYKVELIEFAERFSTSEQRIEILKGLIAYREALRDIGVDSGFQWLDGSFVEDCENTRYRAPNDIDIITFAPRPEAYSNFDNWRALIGSRPDLFDPETTKEAFRCDAYFVDLRVPPVYLVSQTRYWFGLFSHQRETFLWKGMVEVPFSPDDELVSQFLGQEVGDAS